VDIYRKRPEAEVIVKQRSQIMVLAVVLLLVLITGPVLAGTPEEEAQQAAKSWLNLVDTGKYV
jgi:hypothetical protein